MGLDFPWVTYPSVSGLTKQKRYYIAGPMTKYRDQNYNFPAFFEAQGMLEMLGFAVENPARMDLDAELVQYSPFEKRLVQAPGFSLADAMRRDIVAIAKCDGVVLLPDWKSSTGAAQELQVARYMGLPAYELTYDATGWPVLKEI